MISKKFTFLNVGNQATFLGNIANSIDAANIGTDFGWVVDNYVPGDDGLIMLHSFGQYGNQNLFYSLKLNNPSSGTSHLRISGQTGFDGLLGYDDQPGKFTVEGAGLPGTWNGVANHNVLASFVKTPTTKQVIFVNKQNIHVFWEGEVSLYGAGTVYPLWHHFTIGAMDSFFPETETLLNYVDTTVWSSHGWTGKNFMGGWGFWPNYHTNYANIGVRPVTGLLFKQPFDSVPVNKDFYCNDGVITALRQSPRWYSTVHYRDGYNYYSYTSSTNTYNYGSWDYTSWRLGANYTQGLRYNVSFVKHFMHKPVVILYENLDAENIFHYPIAYLPYQAIRMGSLLKGDDTVSFGLRNFAVYPTIRNGGFGMAIEYIEG